MQLRVGVQPGDGLVARFDATVLVTQVRGDREPFVDALLPLLQAAPPDLPWQVARLMSADPAAVPAFGLLLVGDTARVLLHGDVRAMAGREVVRGRDALTWVDCEVSVPADGLLLTLRDDGGVMPDPRSDLRGGLLSGIGVLVRPDPAGAEFPPTTELPSPAPSEPEPPPPPAARPPARDTVAVRHLVSCLAADDGTRTPLDRRYVFGRDPFHHPDVVEGHASPVIVRDTEFLISRVQATLDVEGGTVLIRDARSSNGTFVAAPGAGEWTRIGPDPVPLPVGWSVRMGRRVFTHEGLSD